MYMICMVMYDICIIKKNKDKKMNNTINGNIYRYVNMRYEKKIYI